MLNPGGSGGTVKYTATYEPEAEAVTNMPSPLTYQINKGGLHTVTNVTPLRNGFTFIGWEDKNAGAFISVDIPLKT